jgi:PAS domain S-box-containing protein
MGKLSTVVLRRLDEALPAWHAAAAGEPERFVEPNAPLDRLREVLGGASCVLVDGTVPDAADRVRRAHRADPTVQAVIVAPPQLRERLTRSILFTPGLGEVWIRSPDEIHPDLLHIAGDITRTRRRYLRTEHTIARDLATLEPSRDQRAVITDAYLSALLEAVPDPVLSIDDRGIVLSWNPGAERVLGYARAEAVGRPLRELFLTADGASALLEDEASDGVSSRREIEFRRRDGVVGIAELIVSSVDAAGHRVRAVIIHDLTAERQAQAEIETQAVELEAQAEELQAQAVELETVNDELQDRSDALEHALRSRERFYAAMSHELRTPINAMLGFVDLVLTGVYGPIAPKQEEALVRALRAARHLHELVNDVLDLARIEAGRMEILAEPVRFPLVIIEVIETMRAVADQAGSELVLRGPESHTIRTDPRRLRQILLNLLSNAIKFGLGRPVEIRWQVAGDGGVEVEVVDHGAGIEPADIDRIFDEFTQVGTQSGPGTGLGLPISRRLATLLGGSLHASSTPGDGSTFRVRLPPTAPQTG